MKTVIVAFIIGIVLQAAISTYGKVKNNDHQDCLELLQDLTNIVTVLEKRISSIEDRPEIKIENANVFNMEDDIMIQGDN